MVRTYRMYATVTATASAAATVDIRRPGNIIGASFHVAGTTAPTTADSLRLEVSINSAGQPSTNDASGILFCHSQSGFLTTSGAGLLSSNSWNGPTKYAVKVGDKLYLHAAEAGSTSYTVDVLIHVDE